MMRGGLTTSRTEESDVDTLSSGVFEHTEGELAGTYDWRLVIGGNVVATSHNQGYESKDRAWDMFGKVCKGAYAAEAMRVEDAAGR